jgi:hypothetical protein
MSITAAGATLLMGGVNAGISVVGSLVRNGRMDEARAMLADLPIPPIDKLVYEAQMMNDPEQFVAMTQQRTGMEDIQEDPRLRQAQMGALQGLQDIQAGGGYTTAERGQLDQAMTDALTRQRGAEMAGLQRAQAQGMGGSGLRLASDLARNQGGITAAANKGFNVAQGGMQRALQSMQAGGQLGGQIRGQEFGQQSQVKSAQDAINRANVMAQNQGSQFNIANKQQQEAQNQAAINQQRKHQADMQGKIADMEYQKKMAEAQTYMG